MRIIWNGSVRCWNGKDTSVGGGEAPGCGILRGKGDCASVIIGRTYDLAGKRGLQASGTPFRNGRGCDTQRAGGFPTCMVVEYEGKVLLFDKTDSGDRMLDAFLSRLAERFFDGKRKSGSLRFYEVAPLDAAYRAKIGDGQTVSSDMVRYGICVACCDMAPTLRNFNKLRNLQRQPIPLTGEQEQIVSSLVVQPDNVRFPNVEMRVRIPVKRKGQGMNI